MPLGHLLSFQLYSSRAFPPLERQFATLAALGYTAVEGFPDVALDPAPTRALLDRAGLAMPSTHLPFALFEADPAAVARIAHGLGAGLVVAPWLDPAERPTDADGWRGLGRRLALIARRMAADSLAFAWHNHDFELRPLPDGSLPLDLLTADDDVALELDLAWAARAGVDPAALLATHAGRVKAVHVKDLAAPGAVPEEQGWADLGLGILPWADLWPKAIAAGAELMIVEHDAPVDFARTAANAAAKIRSFT